MTEQQRHRVPTPEELEFTGPTVGMAIYVRSRGIDGTTVWEDETAVPIDEIHERAMATASRERMIGSVEVDVSPTPDDGFHVWTWVGNWSADPTDLAYEPLDVRVCVEVWIPNDLDRRV